MDLQEQQHESRQGQLPTQPRLGQTVTYLCQKLQVSPNEHLRSEVATSSLKVSVLVALHELYSKLAAYAVSLHVSIKN